MCVDTQRTDAGRKPFDRVTARGRALHERVDSGEPETRKGVRFGRSVHVSAENLGVHDVLDMVERGTKTGCLKPVEYKRGKSKPEPFDEIQLCAQALCLEEMTRQTVAEGALWYMQTRHRVPVVFSGSLPSQTLAVIGQVRGIEGDAAARYFGVFRYC